MTQAPYTTSMSFSWQNLIAFSDSEPGCIQGTDAISRNLVVNQHQEKVECRNFTQPTPQTTSEIVNLLIAMKNNNKSQYTLKATSKGLKQISKHADLHNPEQVKAYIANHNVSEGTKKNLCIVYNSYCNHYKIQWEMPKYKPEPKHVKIPTTEKLQMIISASGKTLATKLTLSKETGLRPIEVCNLKVKDIDLEHKVIKPTTAKHGNPRTLKISNSLNEMLQNYIVRKKLNQNDKLFRGNADGYSRIYAHKRNKIAEKLKDPTIQTIRLYDFRHYFATMLYHKTKDILYVKQQMGHKSIENTLKYTQLLQFDNQDNYTCKVAEDIEQATDLIENGFEYITEMNGLKLFRKRK